MVPWYTWAIAALPIGAGVVWYVLRQLQKGHVEEQKRVNAEGFIKSDLEKKAAEDAIKKDVEAESQKPLDLGRW